MTNSFDPNESRSIGATVLQITDKVATLIHDEVELAKAEVVGSVKNLVRGAIVGIVAAVFAVFGLIFLLHFIALIISDAIGQAWAGYGIVAGSLFVLGALAAWIASRKLKKGSNLMPEQAIEEARKTEEAITAKAQEDDRPQVTVIEATSGGLTEAGGDKAKAGS